ncbi:preprotein translocase subunit SecE, partial [Halomonas sp. BM-2019]|uniref:preprotein translocase subunit SecE n=1 Tax=Halomonas sp. BM-2019 TaxID=2811227 RepID=UPI001B3C1D7C
WIAVAVLLSAAVVGNYLLDDLSVVLRAVGVVVLVAAAGFVAAQTGKGKTFLGFAKESRTEVRKVVWPTRKEASQTTLIVIVATIIVALILWGLDGIFVRVVGLATGIRV